MEVPTKAAGLAASWTSGQEKTVGPLAGPANPGWGTPEAGPEMGFLCLLEMPHKTQ